MDKLVVIPAILMAGCVLGAFVMMLKSKHEITNAPTLVKIFGFQLFSPKYLTEQGKIYRRRYWQFLGLAFLFAVLTVAVMYWLVPAFRNEFG